MNPRLPKAPRRRCSWFCPVQVEKGQHLIKFFTRKHSGVQKAEKQPHLRADRDHPPGLSVPRAQSGPSCCPTHLPVGASPASTSCPSHHRPWPAWQPTRGAHGAVPAAACCCRPSCPPSSGWLSCIPASPPTASPLASAAVRPRKRPSAPSGNLCAVSSPGQGRRFPAAGPEGWCCQVTLLPTAAMRRFLSLTLLRALRPGSTGSAVPSPHPLPPGSDPLALGPQRCGSEAGSGPSPGDAAGSSPRGPMLPVPEGLGGAS